MSVATCIVLDPAHVPDSEKNSGQWCDTGNLVSGVPLLKKEKVKRKCYSRCSMQSKVDFEWYPHQRRSRGRGCRFRRGWFKREDEVWKQEDQSPVNRRDDDL